MPASFSESSRCRLDVSCLSAAPWPACDLGASPSFYFGPAVFSLMPFGTESPHAQLGKRPRKFLPLCKSLVLFDSLGLPFSVLQPES